MCDSGVDNTKVTGEYMTPDTRDCQCGECGKGFGSIDEQVNHMEKEHPITPDTLELREQLAKDLSAYLCGPAEDVADRILPIITAWHAEQSKQLKVDAAIAAASTQFFSSAGPSPCGIEGHPRSAWVDGVSANSFCTICRERDQSIAATNAKITQFLLDGQPFEQSGEYSAFYLAVAVHDRAAIAATVEQAAVHRPMYNDVYFLLACTCGWAPTQLSTGVAAWKQHLREALIPARIREAQGE